MKRNNISSNRRADGNCEVELVALRRVAPRSSGATSLPLYDLAVRSGARCAGRHRRSATMSTSVVLRELTGGLS